MKSRAASLSVLVLLLALTVVFASVVWASGQPIPCTDFRIVGTSKWVIPWPPEVAPDGTTEARIKAEGTVFGAPPFDGGRFTFKEWAAGNYFTLEGENHGVMTVKPGPPGGKVDIDFEGISYPMFDPISGAFLGVFVDGTWETARANGHYRGYDGHGTFFGLADLCYPDYGEACPGFYVDFVCAK